ncbi:hypothetical protein GCM10009780_80880 [Actinomadura alba]
MATEEPWDDPRIFRIIEVLAQRTRAGEVEWEAIQKQTLRVGHPGRSGESFSHSTANSTVLVGSQDGDGNYPFLEILDSDGVAVERVVPVGGRQLIALDSMPTENPGRLLNDALRKLYMIVRRTALNTNQVIDDLLSELEAE